MNIVEIIRNRINNIPVEIHDLELQDIKIIDVGNELYFEKLIPELVKKYVTDHKLISFNNETYYTKETICIYDKSLLNNAVGFIKTIDNEYEIESVATCWECSIDEDLIKILKLLNIETVKKDIHYYDTESSVVNKLIIKHDGFS